MRLGLVAALAIVLAGAVASAGCAGPYSGKAESLKKPRAKKRPKDARAATEAADTGGPPAMSDEPCRANFFGDPFRRKRQSREARAMAGEAEAVLISAERSGAQRLPLVLEAMEVLQNALAKDPYAPEPTYKLAVAYALVGRKACSLALLERLKALQQMPEVEAEASRTAQRAARDPAFEPFRGDAKRAVGQ
jgi:hypothetical protein